MLYANCVVVVLQYQKAIRYTLIWLLVAYKAISNNTHIFELLHDILLGYMLKIAGLFVSWKQYITYVFTNKLPSIIKKRYRDTTGLLDSYLSRLPWIFPGAPFTFNGAPGNIHGNLTGMKIIVACNDSTLHGTTQDPGFHPPKYRLTKLTLW